MEQRSKFKDDLLEINSDGEVYSTRACYDLMLENDSEVITESFREESIKRLFAKIGIEVEFVN